MLCEGKNEPGDLFANSVCRIKKLIDSDFADKHLAGRSIYLYKKEKDLFVPSKIYPNSQLLTLGEEIFFLPIPLFRIQSCTTKYSKAGKMI